MRFYAVPSLCLALVLTGCSLTPTAPNTPDTGLAIQGMVHGGQQPISGAHVYLYAAGTKRVRRRVHIAAEWQRLRHHCR